MAIAYVAERAAAAAGSTTVDFSPNTTCVAGHFLVLVVSSVGAGVLSVSDDPGNAWQVDVKASSGIAEGVSICSCLVTTQITGSDNIEITGATTVRAYRLEEFSGIVATNWLDQVASNSDVAQTAMTSTASPATSQANELVIGAFGSTSSGTFTKDAAYSNFTTSGFTGTVAKLAAEYLIVSSTAAQTATGTASVAGTYSAALATYKAAASAAAVGSLFFGSA